VVGNGPTAVTIIAQQHGDEMETSDSAINLVRTLSNGSAESRSIRAAMKVIIVPRVNVDGFDGKRADGTPLTNAAGTQVPPWRENWDPRFTTNPLPAFYARGRGYDINRYHAFRPECPLDNPNYPNFTTVAGVLGAGSVLLELRGGIGTKAGGYIQKIGFHASLASVRELAKDPTLAAFAPELADVLVVPANGVGPSPGPGEAITDGYVPSLIEEADDQHLGN